MSQENFDALETVLEQPDSEFKTNLPDALDGVAENLDELLVHYPKDFEQLTTRMSTLDEIAEYANNETATVNRFLTILWDGLGLITEMVPAVAEEVTEEYTVNWESTDSPVSFHMTSDPDAGTISGGPGVLDDTELTFKGTTDVMFSMLADEEFNGPLAFIQNRYEIIGSLERARSFNTMMETINENIEELA
jgi:hypothetical protein